MSRLARAEVVERGVDVQPAAAESADAGRGFYPEINDRREHRDPAAEQRTHAGGIERSRQFDRPFPIRADAIRESAVAADDHLLGVRTKLVATGQTGLAGKPGLQQKRGLRTFLKNPFDHELTLAW